MGFLISTVVAERVFACTAISGCRLMSPNHLHFRSGAGDLASSAARLQVSDDLPTKVAD